MIRVGVSAAIIRDGQILVIEFDTTGRDNSGIHYNYPGGGVEPGETLQEALVREAREEACAEITVGPLVHVFEYVPALCDAQYGPTPSVRLLFRCELAGGCKPGMPANPDAYQVGVRWVALDDLAGLPDRKPLLPTPSARLLGFLRGPAVEIVVCEAIA